jgi:hypothetical protein
MFPEYLHPETRTTLDDIIDHIPEAELRVPF